MDPIIRLRLSMRLVAVCVLAAAGPGWCESGSSPPPDPQATATADPGQPEDRTVFFGELHLHTGLSLDAYGWGTKLRPDDAYRFGKGEPVKVPGAQMEGNEQLPADREVHARRAWPLDFMAVTDHAENMGVMIPLEDPASDFARSEAGQKYLANPRSIYLQKMMAKLGLKEKLPPEFQDPEALSDAWQLTVKTANDHYEPGRFTTFVAYEYSSMPAVDGELKGIHRNVIFNSDHAPLPFHSDMSERPEDLWTYLENNRRNGIDALAIPHNANLGGGLMYDWNDSDGRPIDADYARRRALNEPLAEITQIKGQSETMPLLSPYDELAGFEVMDRKLGPEGGKVSPQGSYIRQAYGRGLIIAARTGANPFKHGVIGSSDIHNALSTSDEADSAGGQYGIDADTMLPEGDFAKRALAMPEAFPRRPNQTDAAYEGQRMATLERGGGGLAVVWAEENTRESIFAALKRREAYGTSGTRIRLRMFAGWSLDVDDPASNDWMSQAYVSGVPMGSDLPTRPADAGAPRFVLQAMKDLDGANLDRIQVVKVWQEGDEQREKIFDVALSGGREVDPETGHVEAVGNTVDLATGDFSNSIGAPLLAATWQDPEFDAARPSVYYARVLEIPTPRWSTLLAIKRGLPLSKEAPATIQERAWSSPIWYTP